MHYETGKGLTANKVSLSIYLLLIITRNIEDGNENNNRFISNKIVKEKAL
ncbi:uncharacterized protein METZ01_LOCUS474184 [marine metagenome]|uniref:Uncharacterized protein n=1 Tax=marine metagenome TaxID=408172 RepID=A0A383BND2_9ZZZZ